VEIKDNSTFKSEIGLGVGKLTESRVVKPK
jgi:hypothetical protein